MRKISLPSQPEFLSLAETVELLRMKRHTIAQLAREGKIPGRKVGAEWRFPRRRLLAWLGDVNAAAG